MSMPMAQAVAAAFGMPQLANVFYYGKEFGSKKQKLTKEGKLEEEEYQPLSVTQAGAEPEQIAEQIEATKKTEDNIVDQVLKTIDDDTVSFDDLIRILRGQ
jgi:hypothetical protein